MLAVGLTRILSWDTFCSYVRLTWTHNCTCTWHSNREWCFSTISFRLLAHRDHHSQPLSNTKEHIYTINSTPQNMVHVSQRCLSTYYKPFQQQICDIIHAHLTSTLRQRWSPASITLADSQLGPNQQVTRFAVVDDFRTGSGPSVNRPSILGVVWSPATSLIVPICSSLSHQNCIKIFMRRIIILNYWQPYW